MDISTLTADACYSSGKISCRDGIYHCDMCGEEAQDYMQIEHTDSCALFNSVRKALSSMSETSVGVDELSKDIEADYISKLTPEEISVIDHIADDMMLAETEEQRIKLAEIVRRFCPSYDEALLVQYVLTPIQTDAQRRIFKAGLIVERVTSNTASILNKDIKDLKDAVTEYSSGTHELK